MKNETKKEQRNNTFKKRRSSKNQAHKPSQKKSKTRLSYSFKKEDFACKVSQKLRISLGLIGSLEFLRTQCQAPIKILKGYEDPDVVTKGNFRKNYHCLGLAADIQIESLSLRDMFLMVKTIKEFKGIGINVDENYIHVDRRKEDETLMWVEKDNQMIPITEENYEKHLPASS